MELKLSENIRSFRKARRLTQEQFAEVLGVTAGAVYKWESALSVPDISLIVEMADFFDTSVDVLLGYEMKDNRFAAVKERVLAMLRAGDLSAVTEVEKAMKKFPHSFEIVHGCAAVYLIIGTQTHDKKQLRRALELFDQALLLISQNTDPAISEYTIYGEMGDAYIMLGEQEKGLELLKKHNAGGMFSDIIGAALAGFLKRAGEAEPFLVEAMSLTVAQLTNVITGYAFLYAAQGDYRRECEILRWGNDILEGFVKADTVGVLDKMQAMLEAMLAHARFHIGETDEARDALRKAAEHVRRFDAAPDFGLGSARFVDFPEDFTLYDSFGLSAEESVESMLELFEDPMISALWKAALADE